MAARSYAMRAGRIAADGRVMGGGWIAVGMELPRAAAVPPCRGMGRGMNSMETAATRGSAMKASSMKAARAKPAAVEAAATTVKSTAAAVETSAAMTAPAMTASTAAMTSAAGRQRRIREQRHGCCSRENCDERQPWKFAASHVRSHLCQTLNIA
ncbi:hypothetical protein [Bradyrhizobium sp. USDA 3364]